MYGHANDVRKGLHPFSTNEIPIRDFYSQIRSHSFALNFNLWIHFFDKLQADCLIQKICRPCLVDFWSFQGQFAFFELLFEGCFGWFLDRLTSCEYLLCGKFCWCEKTRQWRWCYGEETSFALHPDFINKSLWKYSYPCYLVAF